MASFFFRPFRWIWIAIGALFLLIGVVALLSLIFGPSIFGATFPRPYLFFFPFPFFGFWSFLFVIFIIFLGVRWLFFPWRRRYYGGGYYYPRYDPALQTLRERYARGEITKEQFEQMLRDLQNNR
ncbi:MAG TPA: SHOCT domain-containing protein [Nitrososphaerales archaeon]|nr:SHOCT domain-containing protein [Nitrososphaerales archaeon]